ncbi:MAG: thioredoxin family protein [Roseitalea porphyridii]|uniref:thioredoxin family protein n=1 Tax=Roseitalea porphyridii TaxID=1852022 RepID=UPI0032D8C5E0
MSGEPVADAPITLLDFWADWCGACRMADPIIERVVAGHPDVIVRKVDVATDAALAESHQVRALPTLILTATDGRELVRLSGAMTGKRIEAAIVEARQALA